MKKVDKDKIFKSLIKLLNKNKSRIQSITVSQRPPKAISISSNGNCLYKENNISILIDLRPQKRYTNKGVYRG